MSPPLLSRALITKTLRDLARLRGQVISIGLVIASGVALLVMSLSSLDSLRTTTDVYYERYRFADVFATLKRAPQRLAERIGDIDGVSLVQTRIVKYATIDMEDFAEPVMGKFLSIPVDAQPILNQLVIQQGRLIAPGNEDEVLVGKAFANAHKLFPGDTITAILNGHRRALDIVGIAQSPEQIYTIGPGALVPDDHRFGVIWMGHKALAAAFDLTDSFNDLTIKLTHGTDPRSVVEELDIMLARYGGSGSVIRADQISNWFIMNEIEQRRSMAAVLPVIFLVVSAFLTNMVLTRLIAIERPQIGLLKAFGYSETQVRLHYLLFAFGIALVGIVLGLLLGVWLGRYDTEQFASVVSFPFLIHRLNLSAMVIGIIVSLLAAGVGALAAVRRATSLPPAMAMRPPEPPAFSSRFSFQSSLLRKLDQPTRVILRNIIRFPIRATLTSSGITAAIGLLVMNLQIIDSIDHMVDSYFVRSQHQHLTVGLVEAQGHSVVHDFRHLPGVLAVEPTHTVSVNLSHGTREHRGTISAVGDDLRLQLIFDEERGHAIAPRPDGLMVSSMLADKLQVGIGDDIWVEVLQGRRTQTTLPVIEVFDTYIGMPAYMHIDAYAELIEEPSRVGSVALLIEETEAPTLFSELKDIPTISAVSRRQSAYDTFNETVSNNMLGTIFIFTVLACGLGFGVAYNSARISLSERGRELATLRVLGFTQGETAYILLGELALLAVVAIPFGCWLGFGLSKLIATLFKTELFRVPLAIQPDTYGWAILLALIAAAASGVIVAHRIGQLDMISVLKTRE